jgi:hypothetical protein
MQYLNDSPQRLFDAVEKMNRSFREAGGAIKPSICEDYGMEWEVEVNKDGMTAKQLARLSKAVCEFGPRSLPAPPPRAAGKAGCRCFALPSTLWRRSLRGAACRSSGAPLLVAGTIRERGSCVYRFPPHRGTPAGWHSGRG